MRGKLTNCRTCYQDCTLSGTEFMPKSCVSYKPQITNADRIRAMTDEELVDFLWQFNADSFENVIPFCKNPEECGEKLDSNVISTEMCKHCLLEKLQQPCEEGTV